ncbi:hypothetical protein PTMSG1_09572 [Pyrenophora teres f. maculata]|nr:hypothetical protein PTMSG1_09572 [Pyrenophora teres f. maculata]
MVAFRNIIVAALALAVPIAAQVAVTAKDVTNAIGEAATDSISILKLVTDYPTEGKADSRLLVIIDGFENITHTIDNISKEMEELEDVPERELTDVVFEQYRQFVFIQKALLRGLDERYEVIPAGPIIEALESTRISLNKFFRQLRDVFAREGEFSAQAESLDMSYEIALGLYKSVASSKKRSPTLRRRVAGEEITSKLGDAAERLVDGLSDAVKEIADHI